MRPPHIEYRGRADAGRRQQAERKGGGGVGRNSQNSLVLQYAYRLVTEVRPQTRDRLFRGSASKTLQDSPQLFPLSSTRQKTARALFARVHPLVARPLSPVRHIQEPNHIAPALGAYKEVVSTQVFQPPVPRSMGHHDGCMQNKWGRDRARPPVTKCLHFPLPQNLTHEEVVGVLPFLVELKHELGVGKGLRCDQRQGPGDLCF